MAPLDVVTALHFMSGPPEQTESLVIGTHGGMVVGFLITDEIEGYEVRTVFFLKAGTYVWHSQDNAIEVYYAKCSDHPVVAITSVDRFLLVVSSISPDLSRGGASHLQLYVLYENIRDDDLPDWDFSDIWTRTCDAGQPKGARVRMVPLPPPNPPEAFLVDLWLDNGLQSVE